MARDRESLRLGVEDVDFELQQLVDLALEIENEGEDVTPATSVARLESALLHVRNVLAFYEGGKAKWITVRDYVPKWSPKKSDALKRLRKRRDILNGSLSHLSWDRVTGRTESGENPEWDVWEMADDALTVFAEFVAQLRRDDPEAGEWFTGALAVSSMKLRDDWPTILPRFAEPNTGLVIRRFRTRRRGREPSS